MSSVGKHHASSHPTVAELTHWTAAELSGVRSASEASPFGDIRCGAITYFLGESRVPSKVDETHAERIVPTFVEPFRLQQEGATSSAR